MPTFTPPTIPDTPFGIEGTPSYKLMRHFGQVEAGLTVWRDPSGTYQQSVYPWQGGQDIRAFNDGQLIQDEVGGPGLADASEVYSGGSTHTVTQQQADDLTAAGYGAYINVGPVNLTWRNEDLTRLGSPVYVSSEGVSLQTPTANNNELIVQLGTAGTPYFSNTRAILPIDGTQEWEDTYIRCDALSPLVFGDVDGNQNRPQAGYMLRTRFQNGKWRGVSINNNVAFGFPVLNVGVWEFNGDGTGLVNRQIPIPTNVFDTLPFPYGFEATLTGTIIDVNIFRAGHPSPAAGSIYQRTIDLDADFVTSPTNPTPVGPGYNAVICAHMGYQPSAAIRIRRTNMTRLD